MPDPRFYDSLAPLTFGELARTTGATLTDATRSDEVVFGVANLEGAGSGTVSYCADRRHIGAFGASRAGACFTTDALAEAAPFGCVVLLTPWPQAAYAVSADHLHRARRHEASTLAIHPEARIEDDVVLGPGCVIGPGAAVGRGSYIGPGTVIGPGVAIGRDGHVGANVSIGFALIGDRVRISAGAVIGEPGFGAAAGPGGVIDVPQLGRVIIQDGVTIGSNTCIDRGAWDDTVIGENTKIDNLVQIAHNVVIGRNCLLAAHTGISGSVVVGDGCMFGGRAGIADHITIGAGARIAAAAGIMKDVPAGEAWGGYPARPVRSWMRQTAWLTRAAAQPSGGNEGRS